MLIGTDSTISANNTRIIFVFRTDGKRSPLERKRHSLWLSHATGNNDMTIVDIYNKFRSICFWRRQMSDMVPLNDSKLVFYMSLITTWLPAIDFGKWTLLITEHRFRQIFYESLWTQMFGRNMDWECIIFVANKWIELNLFKFENHTPRPALQRNAAIL